MKKYDEERKKKEDEDRKEMMKIEVEIKRE